MRKILLFIFLVVSFQVFGQNPPGYQSRIVRERIQGSFMVDSGLHIPRYNGLPVGVRGGASIQDGALAMDTTNNRLYIYSGGAWIRLASYSEISGASNIYNSDGILSGDRTLTGLNNTYGLTLDSLNYFLVRRNNLDRLYINNLVSRINSPDETQYIGTENDSSYVIADNNNMIWKTDSTLSRKKISYHGNIHGTFYPYSLVDKSYVDSLVAGAGSPLIFEESVVESNDSVFLDNEKIYPRRINTVYGDSSGIAGYHNMIRVDLSNAIHHSLFRYDTTGTYEFGIGIMEALPDTTVGGGGCVDSIMTFTTGSTLYAPEDGDSTLIHSSFPDKIFKVYRDGEFLYYDAVYGYTVNEDTLFFHPPLVDLEKIHIELKDSTCSSFLALEAPVETPTDMDFDVGQATESPANQWNFTSGDYGGNTLTNMPANGFLQFEIPSDALVVGLDDNSSPDFYHGGGATVVWKYGFYVASGTMYIVVDGQAAASPTNIGAVGTYTHIRMRRVGTTVSIEASVGGTTYSTVYTYSPTLSGDIYVKAHQVSGSGSLVNPKTFGFE